MNSSRTVRASGRRHAAAACLLAVTTSAALGTPPTGDDFNSGDLSRWTPIDALEELYGATSFVVDGGGCRISSVELPPIPDSTGAGVVLSASGADPTSFANGTIRARVRLHNDQTNFLLSMRAAKPGQDGYGFLLNNAENAIGIADIATQSNIAASSFSLDPEIDYMVEATAIGTTISLAVWEAGTNPPASPQLVVASDLYSEGASAAVVYNHPSTLGGTGGVLDATFDDFTFTPAGSTLVDDFTRTLADWFPFPVGSIEIDHSIVDGRVVISSDDLAGNLDGSILLNLPSVSDPEPFSNGSLRASFKAQDTNVILYFRGDVESDTAYAVTFRPTDGFFILSRTATGSEVFLATTFVPYGSGEELMIEISAIGAELAASIWSVHEEKPSEATVTAHDAWYAVGGFALAVDGPSVISRPAPLYVEFGDVWFIPAGADPLPGDLNGDGTVDGADLGILLSAWGQKGPGDLNGDGIVDGADLGSLLAAWG